MGDGTVRAEAAREEGVVIVADLGLPVSADAIKAFYLLVFVRWLVSPRRS